MTGIAYAFGIDALTFLISAVTLWMIDPPKLDITVDGSAVKDNVWASIRSGFLHIWQNDMLRSLFFLIMGINLFINGPVLVGIPVISEMKFTQGAIAFGMLMSAYGGGNLLGIVLAGTLPKPKKNAMGAILLSAMFILGIGIILLGVVLALGSSGRLPRRLHGRKK